MKSAPFNLVIHFPETESGHQALEKRVAQVHAAFAKDFIQKLNCSSEQKINLIEKLAGAAEQK